MINTIMTIIDYGDYFINALLSFFSMNISHLALFLKGRYVLEFETFSGLSSTLVMPTFGLFSNVIGTFLGLITELVFAPARIIGWFTGMQINVLFAFMSLMLWYPIIVGLGKLVGLIYDIVKGILPL